MTQQEKICSIQSIMSFLQDAFESTEIIVLTASEGNDKEYEAGIRTYCSSGKVIEMMLEMSYQFFLKNKHKFEDKE